MWNTNWREAVWSQLEQNSHPWDLVIIGGGITGAGILREAARLGLRVLLVEKRDFSWGTSSRSSKLVHGGFRYLKQGKLMLTRASVMEREQLMHEGPGLIDPLGFLMTVYEGDTPGRWTMELGLSVYDLLALRWDHEVYSPEDFRMLAPHVSQKGLQCGFRYGDAQTDDARLVLRVILEAVAAGGLALNYVCVDGLMMDASHGEESPLVNGVRITDTVTGRTAEVLARVVINATGAWADQLRTKLGLPARIRPLRGSHLIFPGWRLPVAQAINLWHPIDGRPVFFFPWEGATLVGTTDLDHDQDLDDEPAIGPVEVAYLMAAVEAQFPSLNLTLDDILSTYSGVRPVIGTGKLDPSKESREHVIWEENGLLTITGGKLTTFRLIALEAIKAVRSRLPDIPSLDSTTPVLDRVDMNLLESIEPGAAGSLDVTQQRRLLGRYGSQAPALLAAAQTDELELISGTPYLWAELRWAARAEGIVHLDDLLLRRVRLGLLLPEGGRTHLPRIRSICQPELGWSDEHWQQEESAYLTLWNTYYSLKDSHTVPDWKAMLSAARVRRQAARPIKRKKVVRATFVSAFLLVIAGWIGISIIRRRRKG